MIEALGVIWKLLTNLPMLVSVIIELDREWQSYELESQKAQKVQALKNAITQAKTSGDTTKLKALVNSIVAGQPVSGS